MIDFSQLVLAPCMMVFGAPITVTPTKSQPLASPYAASGVWHVENINIVTEDGGNFSNRTVKLGIRLADFAVCPTQGDWITTEARNLPLAYWQGDVDPNSSIDFVIDDQNPDGQGGASLTLKRIAA
jgi:hypothetical protein